MSLSDRLKHFFHVVSNIRPIVWIGLYVAITPLFALIYWGLPDGQFRIPDGAATDFGSWLYYSIVTITTLGFGDYTPAGGYAQSVTAVEVMCGLIFLGLFLNAVGSMKSEIDVGSEIERQKRLRDEQQRQMLLRHTPRILHQLNLFLSYCYAVTTPQAKRTDEPSYNPDFKPADMADMYKPTGLSNDNTALPAVDRLLACASHTSLALDSLQNNIDLRQWPDVLEDCFAFVADYQMFASADELTHRSTDTDAVSRAIASVKDAESLKKQPELRAVNELYHFVRRSASLARDLEVKLTAIAS